MARRHWKRRLEEETQWNPPGRYEDVLKEEYAFQPREAFLPAGGGKRPPRFAVGVATCALAAAACLIVFWPSIGIGGPAAGSEGTGAPSGPDADGSDPARIVIDGIVLETKEDGLLVRGDGNGEMLAGKEFLLCATGWQNWLPGRHIRIRCDGVAQEEPIPLVQGGSITLLDEHAFEAYVLQMDGRFLLVNRREDNARISIHCSQTAGEWVPGSLVRVIYDGRLAESYPMQATASRVDLLEAGDGRLHPFTRRGRVVESTSQGLQVSDWEHSADGVWIRGDMDWSVFSAGDLIEYTYEGYWTAGPPVAVTAIKVAAAGI